MTASSDAGGDAERPAPGAAEPPGGPPDGEVIRWGPTDRARRRMLLVYVGALVAGCAYFAGAWWWRGEFPAAGFGTLVINACWPWAAHRYRLGRGGSVEPEVVEVGPRGIVLVREESRLLGRWVELQELDRDRAVYRVTTETTGNELVISYAREVASRPPKGRSIPLRAHLDDRRWSELREIARRHRPDLVLTEDGRAQADPRT